MAKNAVIETLKQFPWEKEEEAGDFADYLIETARTMEFDVEAVMAHCAKEWDDLDEELRGFMTQALNENILPNKTELYPDLAPAKSGKKVSVAAKKGGAKAAPAKAAPTKATKAAPAPKKTLKAPAKKANSAPAEPEPEPEDESPDEEPAQEEQSGKKKRSKKAKAHTAYHKFCAEHRPAIQEKYKDTGNHSQVEVDLGAMWADAKKDPATLAKYEEMAREYNQEHGFVRKSEQPKSESDKKPMGPYSMYFKEMRPKIAKEDPSLDSKDIMREVGRRWDDLKKENPDAVEEWQDKANQYNEEHGRKAKSEKESGPVDKSGVPTNPYLMFQAEFRNEFTEKNPDAVPDLVKAELKKAYAAVRKDKDRYAHYERLAEEENERRGVSKQQATA